MKKLIIMFAGFLLIHAGFAQKINHILDYQGSSPRLVKDGNGSYTELPAAGNSWHPIGPFGGDITDMAADPINPDRIFAVGGFPYVSEDGGNSWTVLNALASLSSSSVNAIESASNGLMIATSPALAGKILRSTDGGISWQTRNIPVNTTGTCVAMDPNDTNTIYVGLTSILGSVANRVIVKSTDGGLSWTAIDMTASLPVGNTVVDICVDPDNSQYVFAIGRSGFSDALVVGSTDGGGNWEDRSYGLPVGKPYNHIVMAGGKVYVAGGQLYGSQNMGVYESTNLGILWSNISGSFPNKVSNALLINPVDHNMMYVATEGDGIYSTSDGGVTWNYSATGAGDNGAARTLLFRPGSTDIIYAGFLSIAVCKSSDAGSSWVYSNNGIATLTIDDIEVDVNDPSRIILGFEAENSGGCYLSADTGTTWTLIAGLPATRFSKVTFGSDGTMYAWSNGPTSIGQEGLYKSMDNGLTWYNMGPNIGNYFETEIWALAASLTNPNLLFIGGNNFGNNGWASMIYRTTDGGQTWVNVYQGSPDNSESFRYLFIAPGTGDQQVYACFKNEILGGILKSNDGGTTWNSISSGLPSNEKWFGALVSNPDDPTTLLAGLGGYGNHGRIFISEDTGSTWSPSSLSLGTYSRICDMAISPQNSDVIYAATSQDGVMISTDGGHSWDPSNDGLPAVQVSALSSPFQTSSGWNLVASTYTNSAFRTRVLIPGEGISDPDKDPYPVLIYPNPCNGLVTVDFRSCISAIDKIEILDASGRLVRQYTGLDSGSSGTIKTDLPSGFYLCRIFTSNGCKIFKVSSIR
ncbi:MAG: YCF48-related protein [Bacteroidetes bacterium]|nr:YCF48-related protein [Bacteroidota bacterium]